MKRKAIDDGFGGGDDDVGNSVFGGLGGRLGVGGRGSGVVPRGSHQQVSKKSDFSSVSVPSSLEEGELVDAEHVTPVVMVESSVFAEQWEAWECPKSRITSRLLPSFVSDKKFPNISEPAFFSVLDGLDSSPLTSVKSPVSFRSVFADRETSNVSLLSGDGGFSSYAVDSSGARVSDPMINDNGCISSFDSVESVDNQERMNLNLSGFSVKVRVSLMIGILVSLNGNLY